MEETAYVLEVIDAIEAAGLPYMLVGAYSTGVYGIPRSTKDADFLVALGQLKVSQIAARLDKKYQVDPQIRFESVTGQPRRIIRIADSPFTVEIFPLSADAHDKERFSRRRRLEVPQLGRSVYLPAAEDVVITKLRWYAALARGKDADDARDVMAVQGDALDWPYIESWCGQHGTRGLLEEIRASIPPLD